MGRIFETRKATMFARWDRMAKAFTRVSKEIAIAAKSGGGSPESNPQLRRAIQNARAVNMPKDKIENAIKRALGKDAADYAELIYEGYAPHGVAVLAVAATDNPTRTIANVRVCFNKGGGSLVTSGSVSFAFKRMGVFRLDPQGLDLEDLELYLMDHGLEEFGEGTGEKGEAQIVARCALQDFGPFQSALEARNVTVIASESEFVALNPVELPEDKATEVLKMVDLLEQDDDVQHVYHNLV